MRLMRTGEPIDAAKTYTVAGWASVNAHTEGPPVYDLVSRHIERNKIIAMPENRSIRVAGG